jgi:tetratricopeptide (TPR) repeat protein
LIELRSNSPIGYFFRASVKGGQGDYVGADQDLKQAIALSPESPDGYVKLGMLRGLQKQYGEAEKYFEVALQKDPSSTEALTALVNTYSTTKVPTTKSIARINAQLSKAPQNPSYWVLLARTQSEAGDLKMARTSLEHALAISPNLDDALTLLVETDASLGNLDNAASACRQLIANNPRSATPLIMMATLEQRRSNFDAAQQFYQRALSLQPDHPLAANNLAFLMMEHGGNIDVALSLAQTARRAMPNYPSTADTLGLAYYMKGLYGSARDVLESAAKTAPDNAAIQYHLAMTYDKISEPAKATEHYKKALQLAPDGPNAAAIRQALSAGRG